VALLEVNRGTANKIVAAVAKHMLATHGSV